MVPTLAWKPPSCSVHVSILDAEPSMIKRFWFGSVPASDPADGNHAHGGASDGPTSRAEARVSRRELRQLKWLTALVPGTVVLIYESARQEALEHVLPALPVQYGNLVVWVLVLLL